MINVTSGQTQNVLEMTDTKSIYVLYIQGFDINHSLNC